jgi:cyclopropane fatty-acyl-phospholipid synthase-like methyltransferase
LYTEDYFLTACEGYAEFAESHGEHLSRRLTAAFEVAAVEPGMRVLDVGCGRGEILRRCAQLGARAYGIDYADVAVRMSHDVARAEAASGDRPPIGVQRADAKRLPYPAAVFDRVLIFDVVEHLFPWELDVTLKEAQRVLRPGGMLAIHTAPNRWYDRYAYPAVRLVRTLQGRGAQYPANPRALNVAANVDVHVNEQDVLSLRRYLKRAGFVRVKVWLDSPPQQRRESALFRLLRTIAFGAPPLRWFFEREVFAVGVKL